MKLHQKLLWVLGLVALGAFSLAGFLSYVGFIPRMTAYRALTAMWYEPTIGLIAGAVFLFLLALSIYLPISTWLKAEGGVVTFSNPLGTVEISREVVSRFIRRVGQEMGEVEGVKVEIKPVDEGARCYVTLAVCSEAEGGIPRLLNSFQELVKKHLVETVGVADVKEVKVKVTKIFSEKRGSEVNKGEKIARFKELGKTLDHLAGRIRGRTQEELEKGADEIKDWGTRLDKLGEKIKKTTQEGMEKFSVEAKGMVQAAKLRSGIRETQKKLDSLVKELGERTYRLHLKKKIGNVELKKLGGKITQIRKEIAAREKRIQRLREK